MFPPQPHLLPHMSVKGYRELLKRFRQQTAEDASTSSALFQQAKELAVAHLQSRQSTEKLNPKRAFSKLRQRIVEAKHDLKELKDQKKHCLKAKYTALKEQRLTRRRPASEEILILGSNSLARTAVLGAVGLLSRGFMTLLTNTDVKGADILHQAFNRPSSSGMITVSNHSAALDDPLLVAALMPAAAMLKPEAYRWGMCATDRCFKNSLLTSFFRAGKTLPVERGAGMDQPGMRAAEARLNAGDWVHIFPEGTRSRDGKMGPIRKGIGHLITACTTPPLVVPFVHTGMQNILPAGSSLPKLGQTVRVLVGEPISFEDLHDKAQEQQWSSSRLSLAITQRVADTLYNLRAQLEGVPISKILQQGVTSPVTESEALLPLIEEQIDGLKHSWRHSSLCKVRPSLQRGFLQPQEQPWNASPMENRLSLHQQLQQLKWRAANSKAVQMAMEYFNSRTAAARNLVAA